MGLTLELPEELAEALTAEAAAHGLTLSDYAVQLLSAAHPQSGAITTGAELVAYWQANGVIGSRPDIADSAAHARQLRERAEQRGT
jgi:hypothetical protein